ncbi:hypothetical protein HF086_014511 [Spodoptera exigua]|uniref:Uncharacterized protein n=1 Tax=Spodoptera exigua TaxID=7107 RepID=A0A922SJT1_SPOEX|nr:hypothetical protein HF086_014511 [Spodoptera exigua]
MLTRRLWGRLYSHPSKRESAASETTTTTLLVPRTSLLPPLDGRHLHTLPANLKVAMNCAGLHHKRERKRRSVSSVRRGAGEAAAPAHPARGRRSPWPVRPRLSRLSCVFVTAQPRHQAKPRYYDNQHLNTSKPQRVPQN